MKRNLAGTLLRSWRIKSGLTQKELARRSGVSEAHIQAIEQGVRPVTLPGKVSDILRAVGFSRERAQQLAEAAEADEALLTIVEEPSRLHELFRLPLDRGRAKHLMYGLTTDEYLYEAEAQSASESLLDLFQSATGEGWQSESIRQQAAYYLIQMRRTEAQTLIRDIYPRESLLVRRAIEIAAALVGDRRLLHDEMIERLMDDDLLNKWNLAYYLTWHGENVAQSAEQAYTSIGNDWAGHSIVEGLTDDLTAEKPIRLLVLVTLSSVVQRKGGDVLNKVRPRLQVALRQFRHEAQERIEHRVAEELTPPLKRLMSQ